MNAALESVEFNVKSHDAFFIGGKWVKPAGTGKLNVISPVTEEVIMTFPEASERDVDRAVAAAREAFDDGPWPRLSGEERGAFLIKVAQNLTARLPEVRQSRPMCRAPGRCRLERRLLRDHAPAPGQSASSPANRSPPSRTKRERGTTWSSPSSSAAARTSGSTCAKHASTGTPGGP